MKTILAYSLPVKPQQTFELPAGAQLLHAGLDIRNNACLWALADESAQKVKVELVMLRIGQEMPLASAKYVGQFKDNSGVWHVFVEATK